MNFFWRQCDNSAASSIIIIQDRIQSDVQIRQLRRPRGARERRGGAAEQRHVLRLSRLLQMQRPLQTRR